MAMWGGKSEEEGVDVELWWFVSGDSGIRHKKLRGTVNSVTVATFETDGYISPACSTANPTSTPVH